MGVHYTGCASCALHIYQLGAAPAHAQGVQGLPSAAACAVGIQLGARQAAVARDIYHARVAALVRALYNAASAIGRDLRMALLIICISCICCVLCTSCLYYC